MSQRGGGSSRGRSRGARYHNPYLRQPTDETPILPSTAAAHAAQPTQSTGGGGGDVAHLGERVVVVQDFAAARLTELRALRLAVRNDAGPRNRRVYQQLPWHLRRRTMSHSSWRMPVRRRVAAERELTLSGIANPSAPTGPSGKFRCRKHRRRAGWLLDAKARRATNPKWLETHIWHAKRMHMRDMFGRILPECPVDRGERSAHRAASNGCTIHDRSYHEVFQLQGDQGSLERLLGLFTSPDYVFTDPSTQGELFLTGVLMYHPGLYPAGLIAPVDLLFRATESAESKMVWLWIHPSAAVELKGALAPRCLSGDVQFSEANLIRFSLVGPLSNSVLTRVLIPVDNQTAVAKFCEQLAHVRSPACIRAGTVVSLTVKDPRCSFPPRKAAGGRPPREAMESPTLDSSSPIWELSTRNQLKSLGGDKVSPEVRSKIAVPVLLLHCPSRLSRGYGSGWDLILPQGWSMAFWMSFAYAGARPIGQRELRLIALESGTPFFPVDFPETLAGHAWDFANEEMLKGIHDRKPPSKRINYSRIRMPFPFRPDYQFLVSMGSGGQPSSKKQRSADHAANVSFYVVRDGVGLRRISPLSFPSLYAIDDDSASASLALVQVTIRPLNRGRPRPGAIITELSTDDVDSLKNAGTSEFHGATETRGVKGDQVSADHYKHLFLEIRLTLCPRVRSFSGQVVQ